MRRIITWGLALGIVGVISVLIVAFRMNMLPASPAIPPTMEPVTPVIPDKTGYEVITPDNALYLREISTIETGESVFGDDVWPAFGFAYSPDSQEIAAGLPGVNLGLWNVETGGFAGTLIFEADNKTHDIVSSIKFSDDNRWVVATSKLSHQLMVWRISRALWPLPVGQVLIFKQVNSSIDFALSPKNQLALVDYLDTVQLWDLNELRGAGSIEAMGSLRYSNDGTVLRVGNHLYDTEREQRVGTANDDLSYSPELSPDGVHLLVPQSNSVELWDIQTNTLLQSNPIPQLADIGFVYSPDRKTLITAHNETTFMLWDGVTGELLHEYKGKHVTEGWNRLSDMAYSPNSSVFATAMREGYDANELAVWDQQGKPLVTLLKETSLIGAVHFAPDGRTLAVSTWDGKIHIFAVVR